MSEALQAGRELDALVATALDWHDFTESLDGSLIGLKAGDSRPRSGNTAHHQRVPLYSSDISASFTAVEAMRAKGWAVDITSHRRSVTGWSARCLIRHGVWFDAEAETVPLAICMIALAALEASTTNSAVPTPSLTLPPSEPRPANETK